MKQRQAGKAGPRTARRSMARLATALLAGSTAISAGGCVITFRHPEDAANESVGASSAAQLDAAKLAAWRPKQAAFDARFAAELSAYRALEPSLRQADRATDETAQKAYELRDRFTKRCVAESGWSTVACWNATFARDITEALAAIRTRQGDHVGAALELLTRDSWPDMRSDEAKIKATESPVGRVPSAWRSPELNAAFEHIDLEGSVQAISVGKTTATIAFKPEGGGRDSSTTCHEELGRDARGDLVVNRPCTTTYGGTLPTTYIQPITVPASELAGLDVKAKGLTVRTVCPNKGKRDGHVLDAWLSIEPVNSTAYGQEWVLLRQTPMKAADAGYP